MRKRHQTKLIHEGDYVAEVDVEFVDTDGEWSPYLSLDDALKLDDVRLARRQKDLATVARYARIFSLTPVAL